MRRGLVLALFAVLAGCVQPLPGATDPSASADGSTSSPTPTTSVPWYQQPGCSPQSTALWLEPGVWNRAAASDQIGDPVAPSGGYVMANGTVTERYGPTNATILRTPADGVDGKSYVVAFEVPDQFTGRYFGDASTQDVRDAFAAFAGQILDVDADTLRALASQFAANQTSDGSYHLVVDGPFQIDAYVAGVLADAAERWIGPKTVTLESANGTAVLALETRVGAGLVLNAQDRVQYQSQGHGSDLWRSANETFAGLGWPAPDLTDANVQTYVC